jgi:hypothetical protein
MLPSEGVGDILSHRTNSWVDEKAELNREYGLGVSVCRHGDARD